MVTTCYVQTIGISVAMWSCDVVSVLQAKHLNFCIKICSYRCYLRNCSYTRWFRVVLILQAQFTGALLQCVYSLYIDCNFPKWMHYILLGYATSFIILFTNFYLIAYTKKGKTSSVDKSSEESTKIPNGSAHSHENDLLAKKED